MTEDRSGRRSLPSSEATEANAKPPTLYEGVNQIIINASTMRKIIADWITRNHGGVRMTVNEVNQVNNGLLPDTFNVKFIQEPYQ